MIRISSGVLSYEFGHHINVIGGYRSAGEKSGVYKTMLYSMLEDANINGQVVSNMPLVFLNNITVLSQLQVTPDVCYLIDEVNFSPNNFNNFFAKLRHVNGFAIIIGRMRIKQIDYSVDAIYSLDSAVPPFNLSKVFVRMSTFRSIENDLYVTEDSKVVADYYSQKTGYTFVAASGKDRIYKYLKKAKNPFIIADNAKFGNVLLNILERRYNLDTIDLFLPVCFEEFLLNSGFRVLEVSEHVENNIPLNYVDGESFCEKCVSEHCGNVYSKSNMSGFIKCLSYGLRCMKCDIKIENSDLFVLLLEHLLHKDSYSYSGSKSICYTISIKDFKDFIDSVNEDDNNIFYGSGKESMVCGNEVFDKTRKINLW